jgi:hypothetical protein
MHLLDPRAGLLPVALCVFLSGTILISWIQAARQDQAQAGHKGEDASSDDSPPQSKSA